MKITVQDETAGTYTLTFSSRQRERVRKFLQSGLKREEGAPFSGWFLFLTVPTEVSTDENEGSDRWETEAYVYITRAPTSLVAFAVINLNTWDRVVQVPACELESLLDRDLAV